MPEDAPRPAQAAIRTDLGAILVSMELSRRSWLLTSLSPGGGEKMMGSEGWGGNNLSRALAAHQRQERGTLRTHPTRRPREDIFLPEQNSLSACRSSWPVQA